ncbi:type VI secretion system tube protein Hcp [Pseudomonas defluvii]|uniref:type VI secretion system tube protein Hcp n=1 Tax=Pseudomonas defluvii TaxID=1876757 RepID=UPI003905A758
MILVKFNPEIKGTSKVAGYEGWVVFDSYALNASRNISGSGVERSLLAGYVSDILLMKTADKSSPQFFIQSLTGTAFKEATVVVLHASGATQKLQQLLSIELTAPVVSTFSTQCQTDGRPTEHISLNFTRIRYQYNEFDGAAGNGTVDKVFDVAAVAAA